MRDGQDATFPPSIAIVGMSGRFPGAADLEEFWQMLRQGVEAVRFFEDEELIAAGVDPAQLADPQYVKARAVLDGVDRFDAPFFGFTPREAELTDPQQRLFLEICWQALESAGYDPASYDGEIGLWAGSGVNAYLLRNLASRPELLQTAGIAQTLLHNKTDHLTTRVAYKLDLRGPSITVQTACSTSLVAVSMACQSLIDYQCDMALAGGSSVVVPQVDGYVYHAGGIESPDGHCRAFDARAQGTVVGNGLGVVALKRLEDALEDNDTILAVIRGSALNNDGSRKIGYTAPSEERQAEVIALAQGLAEIEPSDVQYIEAHGTGTPMGDPIEIAALRRAFERGNSSPERCWIGSVKSNIGHLDAAAGVAGLIKTVLALQHREIPPSLHFETPNPAIDFASTPFEVNGALRPWDSDGPRLAGVSSFGIGGTNAHVVVEEAPVRDAERPSRPWQVLLLSARSSSALEGMTERLAEHLRQHPEVPVADTAYTLQVGRRRFDHRRTILCRSNEDAVAALDNLAIDRISTRFQPPVDRPLIFLFPGQGAQYVGMGRELYERETVFRNTLDRCAEILEPQLGLDLRRLLYPAAGEAADADARLTSTAMAQPALVSVELALARQLIHWGLEPRGMIGHSLGEYVAACLADALPLEDALALVAARGRLMASLPEGAMTSVQTGIDEVRTLCRDLGIDLSTAAVNSPNLCVMSGAVSAIEALEQALEERQITCRRLVTRHAFHSPMMEPILDAFREELEKVRWQTPSRRWISNLSGTWITDEDATDPDYWIRHLRQPVQFSGGLETLFAEPEAVFLEVGPGRSLKTICRWHTGKRPGQVVDNTLPHPREAIAADQHLFAALGRLFTHGVEPDWSVVHGEENRRRVPLPTYPFERRSFWIAERPRSAPAEGLDDDLGKRPDPADWTYLPLWRDTPPAPDLAVEAGTWLLLGGELPLADALAERILARGGEAIRVLNGERFEAIAANAYRLDRNQPEHFESLFASLGERDRRPTVIAHLWTLGQNGAGDRADRLERGLYSLLHLVQAWGQGPHASDDTRLVLIADRAQAVGGETPPVAEKAAAVGLLRAIPREYPTLTVQHLDILPPPPGSRRAERLAEAALREILAPVPEPAVAYRGTQRRVLDYEPWRVPAGEVPTLRADGLYAITGGLGGIGLAAAERLAEIAPVKLLLIARTALPPREAWSQTLASTPTEDPVHRTIQALRRIEAHGAEVMTAACDVSDRNALAETLETARARFGPIYGALHAAGVAGGGLLALRQRDDAAAVLAPKVDGGRALSELLADDPLDFLVFFSSLSAVVGRLGQADYGAANAFLDALAHEHVERHGTPALSINWGEWQNVGMASDATLPGGGNASWTPVDHPLFDRKRPSDDGEELFLTDFSPERHWVLDEHRLIGNPVLPGVAYLEMVRGALADRADGRMLEFRGVLFVSPLRVRDGQTRRVWLRLVPEGEGYRFVVESLSEFAEADGPREDLSGAKPEDVQRFALGQVVFTDPVADDDATRIDLDGLIRNTEWTERPFGEDDLDEDLGPRWQNVRTAWVGQDQVLSWLELPEDFAPDFAAMLYHPAVMDRAAGVAKEYLFDAEYLPLAYERIRLERPVPRKIFSHARYQPEPSGDTETLTWNTNVYDAEGRRVVELTAFAQKRISDPVRSIKSYAGTEAEGAEAGEPTLPTPAATPIARPEPSEDAPAAREEMQLDEGLDVLLRLLGRDTPPQVAVSVRDLRAVIAQANTTADDRLAEEAGKVSRGLRRHGRPDLDTPYEAPRTPLETQIADAWAEMLGLEAVGIADDFFALGGDSLQAVQIIAQLQQGGVRVTPQQFFQAMTVEKLAEMVADGDASGRATSDSATSDDPEWLDDPFAEFDAVRWLGHEAAANVDAVYPLSATQQGMLFHSLYHPGSGDYILQVGWSFHGPIDDKAFETTWRELVERHAVLRTAFYWQRPKQHGLDEHRPDEHGLDEHGLDEHRPDENGSDENGSDENGSDKYSLDEPVQAVCREVELGWQDEDWRSLDAEAQARAHDRFLEDDRQRGFDLTAPPLMRLTRLRLSDTVTRVVWTCHHLIVDGWAIALLLQEAFAVYGAKIAGREASVEARRPYRDYVAWQHRRDMAQAEAFWRPYLAGFNQPTPMIEKAPSPLPRTDAGDDALSYLAVKHTASADLHERIQGWTRQHRLTLGSLLTSAWGLLLSRYSGRNDVLFGGVVSGRSVALDGLAEMLGTFINTLPVRLQLDPEQALEPWLRAVQNDLFKARQDEDVPLVKIREWSEMKPGETLFDSLLVLENLPLEASLEDSTDTLPVGDVFRSEGRTGYALSLVIFPGDDLVFQLTADAARFDRVTLQRVLHHFEVLVEGMLGDASRPLGDLPLLTDAEQHLVLTEWNDSALHGASSEGASSEGASSEGASSDGVESEGAGSDSVESEGVESEGLPTIDHLFAQQVARTPDGPAARCGDAWLSFAELDRRADHLARTLIADGVTPESLVVLALDRCLEMAVGALGILKAGGAYLPLDPRHPRERWTMTLRHAAEAGRLTAILTTADLAERADALVEDLPGQDLPIRYLDRDPSRTANTPAVPLPRNRPEQLLYVIFTSGSTGRPKGVMIEHRQLANYVLGLVDRIGWSPETDMTMVQPLAVDASLTAFFPPLLCGGRLHLVPYDRAMDPHAMAEDFAAHRLTELKVAPSYLAGLQAAGDTAALMPRRRLIFGGEASRLDWLEDLRERAPHCELMHHYGPTEATVGMTVHRVPTVDAAPSLSVLPIGRPLPNCSAMVADARARPVPAGVRGELLIGGDCLARGYLDNPSLTAARFVPDPRPGQPGARLYRSGDLVRWLLHGEYQWLGRIDDQVKIRGYRIEPAEIESVLARHPDWHGVVVVRQTPRGEPGLVAYVVPTGTETDGAETVGIDTASLRRDLEQDLPPPMVPALFVVLDDLPRTIHGKVDRQNLPEPVWEERAELTETDRPQSPAERALAAIWSEVLGRQQVGVHESFFDLGGDSILSLRIVAKAAEAGFKITLAQIFELRTVAALAAVAEAVDGASVDDGPVVGDVLLTPIQQRLFDDDPLEPHHDNQAVMLRERQPLAAEALDRALGRLLGHHDALRARFERSEAGWRSWIEPVAETPDDTVHQLDLSHLRPEDAPAALERAAGALQASLDLARGPVVRAGRFLLPEAQPARLLLIIHHLAVDGVSWGILLEDFERAYRDADALLPSKTLSVQSWAEALHREAESDDLDGMASTWWRDDAEPVALPIDHPEIPDRRRDEQAFEIDLDEDTTRALLQEVPQTYGNRVDEVLLAALGETLGEYSGSRRVPIDLERHGREALGPDVDVSRTVGWFTSVFPFAIDLRQRHDPAARLTGVKEDLRAIPRQGAAWGLITRLRRRPEDESLRRRHRSDVLFNYLGSLETVVPEASLFVPTSEPCGPLRGPRDTRPYAFEILASVFEGRLRFSWHYNPRRHEPWVVEDLAQRTVDAVRRLIDFCQGSDGQAYTPSDFPETDLDQLQLDKILSEINFD